MKSVTFTPAVPTLTYQKVVEQIEQAILSGDIQPGQHLPSERELMVQLSVSRPTVREALRVLQSQGLIASKPGGRGGPVVLPVSPDTLGRSFTMAARIASLSLSELVQFRIVLESSACQLASALRTPEQLRQMRDAVERMEAEVANGSEEFNRADLDFHAAIWEASHNSLLRVCGQAVAGSILNLMNDRMQRLRRLHLGDGRRPGAGPRDLRCDRRRGQRRGWRNRPQRYFRLLRRVSRRGRNQGTSGAERAGTLTTRRGSFPAASVLAAPGRSPAAAFCHRPTMLPSVSLK